MKNYIKLLHFLKGHRKLFALAVFIMLLASLLEGFQFPALVPLFDRIFSDKDIIIPNNLPAFLQNGIDYINSVEKNTLIKWVLIFAPVIILLKNFIVALYSYLMSDISQRIMKDIRNKIYAKIQNLSLDYFSEKRTGELISRITYDVNAVENALSYALIDLFRQSSMILIYMATSFLIYPKAAFIVYFIFPFVAIPLRAIGKKLKQLSRERQEKMADINSLLIETISGVKMVKASCTEDYETKRFMEKNHDFYKIIMKGVKRLVVISPITEIFGGICGTLMIWMVASDVMEGRLSPGVFILFFGSIVSIISPIKKLGNVNALIQQAMAASDRIYSVLDAEITVKEKEDAVHVGEMSSVIELKDVHFHYDEESGSILDGINLEIKKGELVAIVGPTGTGKTTLVNLIPRFYDPTQGSVRLDGVDLKDVSFSSLRKQMGIVTQESILFNDTVRSNIAYGTPDMDLNAIESSAKKAFAHRFIEKMPQGYDTIIGDRGFRLSGGEKQRISIARAILKNPPILILDEATSQLDSESEKFVQEALDELMQGRTVIAIAHRLSTVIKADKIVVLENGKIVGLGKHEELLKTCSLYAKLHQMQFQDAG